MKSTLRSICTAVTRFLASFDSQSGNGVHTAQSEARERAFTVHLREQELAQVRRGLVDARASMEELRAQRDEVLREVRSLHGVLDEVQAPRRRDSRAIDYSVADRIRALGRIADSTWKMSASIQCDRDEQHRRAVAAEQELARLRDLINRQSA